MLEVMAWKEEPLIYVSIIWSVRRITWVFASLGFSFLGFFLVDGGKNRGSEDSNVTVSAGAGRHSF